MEKSCPTRQESVTRLPELPWASQLFIHFLSKQGILLHGKQKVGSARRVTCLAGSPLCGDWVTLLVGPTFLHINTLARSVESTRSRLDNQSMCERCFRQVHVDHMQSIQVSCWLWRRRQLFFIILNLLLKSWLSWDGDNLPRTGFLHINWASEANKFSHPSFHMFLRIRSDHITVWILCTTFWNTSC